VHTFDSGRVHPDLVSRARRREVGHQARIELEGQCGGPLTIGWLEEIRPNNGGHQAQHGAQHAIIGQARNVGELSHDVIVASLQLLVAGRGLVGIETSLEVSEQRACHPSIGGEGGRSCRQAVSRADLAQIGRQGAHDRGLLDTQSRQHQPVESVGFDLSAQHGPEGPLEFCRDGALA
jgi:hypothetical protein